MDNRIYAPCSGRVKDITEVSDGVFAGKMVGDGVAIEPADALVCAPVSGLIRSMYPTNHAFVMEAEGGASILVHIGLETVGLQGKCFKRLQEPGVHVKKGTPIVRVNYRMIRHKKLEPDVIVVVPGQRAFCKMTQGQARMGESVLFETE